jgi:hypothetical protein
MPTSGGRLVTAFESPTYPGGWRFKATLHRMRGEDEAERSAWARSEDIDG